MEHGEDVDEGEELGPADGLLARLELETSMPWTLDGRAHNLHRANSVRSNCYDMLVEVPDILVVGLDDVLQGQAPCKLPLEEQDVRVCHIWWKCQKHLLECLHVT